MTPDGNRPYPPDFPRRFLAPRYWGIWLGLGLHALFGLLPTVLRRGLGTWLGMQAYRRNAKRSGIARLNLAWCFNHWDEARREAVLRDSFRSQGAALADFGLFWWASRQRFFSRIVIEGEQHLAGVLNNGGRAILVTVHSHGMDFGGIALSGRWPLVTYANRMRNPLIEWLMSHRRTRFGCLLYTREEGMRPVIREVKAGRVFFYPVDEDGHGGEAVFAPFFGVPKSTLTAPFRLARLCQARLIPCTTWYRASDKRYVVQILPPLENVPSGDPAADAERLNAAFEELVMLAPEQYMWGQRIFQTRPDGKRPY
ncbi:MAG: lysophospholipid acyltransferase family protein [Pseudomonadota bacterium]